MEEKQKKKGTIIKVITAKRPFKISMVDSVLIFYRDENGVKQRQFVDRAQLPYYLIKDKESPEALNPKIFIKKELVEKNIAYSDCLYREIAQQTKAINYYTQYEKRYDVKNILKHPWVYDADMDISDRYIANFNEEYEPDVNYRIHKAYYDIETDLMPFGFVQNKSTGYTSDGFVPGKIGYIGFPEPDEAPCPINIITFIDETSMTINSYIIRNRLNTSQLEFENRVEEFKKYIIEKLQKEYDVAFSGIDIQFFNEEKDAIVAFFKKMHELDPDFALGWNCEFDLKTMTNRLAKAYSNPVIRKGENIPEGTTGRNRMQSLVCDEKCLYNNNPRDGDEIYLTPMAKYYTQNDKPYVDRMDEFKIIDGINWMDQMLLFANIRKSGGQRESYALDAIAFEELGREKLPFEPGETIKNLPWKNFWKFTEYNIIDNILLLLLERKNLDTDLIQRLSEITNTRKEKVFKKTISIKNFVNKYALMKGYVMATNKNSKYGDSSDDYEAEFMPHKRIIEANSKYLEAFNKKDNFGAYVQNPALNLPEGVKDFSGKPSDKIFEYVCDFDFSSLYPSILLAFNLDSTTEIGRFFLIDDHIKNKLVSEYGYADLFDTSKNEKADKGALSEDNTDLGPTFVDSLQSQDWDKVGIKYFDLPSTEELIEKLRKKG